MIDNVKVKKIVKELGSVDLLVATKGRSAKDIRELYKLGVREFGSSYLQEAEEKIPELSDLKSVKWHFIGHIQKNKARKIVGLFESIDSVDSYSLAKYIDGICKSTGRKVDVMVQVNISGEKQKGGVLPEKLEELLDGISGLSSLNLKGLMVIGSIGNAESEYKEMKQLFDKYKKQYKLKTLSMGMSSDYKVAIKNGATMVRLGRVLFE